MQPDMDIRWQQRFQHYQKALAQLAKAVRLSQERPLSDIEQQGLIKAFEFTHELAWNVMKDYFEFQGNTAIMGSRDATREAFQRNLVTDGSGWMEMIRSRNMTSHTYNQDVADEISQKIIGQYFALLEAFAARVQGWSMPADTEKLSFGLSEGTVERIREVFARHPLVRKVILYGSRAKGTYRNGSDIDLTIEGETVTLSELMGIETELDDLLLPYKIDLSLLHRIEDASLLDHIKRVGVAFFER